MKKNTQNLLKTALVTGLLFCLPISNLLASSEGSGDFNPGETIIHHISDANEIHLFSAGDFHATIPLPVILYKSGQGLTLAMSSSFHHGHEIDGYGLHHGKIHRADHASFLDFSITKNVFMMLICAGLLLWMFLGAAKKYREKEKAPSGMQNLLEVLILFVRDEVARPILGDKAGKYMPYLLTLFFFIWVCNMIGLIPGFGANITGNIAVTLTLAAFTFVITLFSSNKHFWGHIFAPPGVPPWLLPIMIPVEVIGIFTKPVALLIRLFANMTAGHMIILSIVCLIFIFGKTSAVAGYGVAVVSVAFTLFMMMLELLVAALQAYIFTILSALYFSEASAGGEH